MESVLFSLPTSERVGNILPEWFRDLPRPGRNEDPVKVIVQGHAMSVLQRSSREGPALVHMDQEALEMVNSSEHPVRATTLSRFREIDPWPAVQVTEVDSASRTEAITITCIDRATRERLSALRIDAFHDFTRRRGYPGFTNRDGEAMIQFHTAARIERLLVSDTRRGSSYWGAFRADLPYKSQVIELDKVETDFTDVLRHYYPKAGASGRFDPSAGVLVGVVDTGIGPHSSLTVVGGCCTVLGEDPQSFGDVRLHGTHVGGIIGSSSGVVGIAPGVKLRSYRVYKEAGDATSYSVTEAIGQAARDGCDIINLSIGNGPCAQDVAAAIKMARELGSIIVSAAGNDVRGDVDCPAALPGVLAVSAMGRLGTFPAGALAESEIVWAPRSTSDPKWEFISALSNRGNEIAFTAPGVGILSCFKYERFGVLSGTSMAAAAVSGLAACLLSKNPALQGMDRNERRASALEDVLRSMAVKHGFGPAYEGNGRIQPKLAVDT